MANSLQRQLSLGIADIVISVTASTKKARFRIFSPYRSFVRELKDKKPDINLTVHYGNIPDYKLKNPIFKEERLHLSLYQSDGQYILKIPSRLMVVDSRFSCGDIYIKRPSAIVYRQYPLQHPLDKIVVLHFLAERQGAMIHACGINYDGKGLLFAGASGAGKSTLANLWKRAKDTFILNDDRIILRKLGKRFWLYGTPWHGDARVYSFKRVPLKKIFFLRHAQNNAIKKIEPLDAIARLLGCSLFFFWQKKTLESLFDLYAELTRRIPCYELGFVPDEGILDFIRNKA